MSRSILSAGVIMALVLMLGCRGYSYQIVYRVALEPSDHSSEREIERAVEVVRAVSQDFSLFEAYRPDDPNPVSPLGGYRLLVMAQTKKGVRHQKRKVDVSVSAMIAEDGSELRFNIHDLRNETSVPLTEEMEEGLRSQLVAAFPDLPLEREEGRFDRHWFSP